MKRSPHPCGQRESRGGGKKNPWPPPLIPPQSRTQNPRYASNARHTPASGHAGPSARPRRSLSRAHTHAHARAPAHTHVTRTPPKPPPRSGDPPRPTPAFFLAPGLLSTCWVGFFLSGVGGGKADIMGEIRCAESNMAKINIFGV